MNFLQTIEAIWRNVSLVQRALLIVITLTFVIVAGVLVHWARKPDMRVLYSSLDTVEAARITEKISDKDIEYKLGSGGTTIYVPREHVTQLRLDMAKEGLPEGGLKGYKIFEDQKIGISPSVQNINLKRALQEELARSIQMIDGILQARIHLVTSKSNLFSSTATDTTASVILRLKPGYRLSGGNIAAITHLVAGSVEGLKSEKVTIVDSQGQLLSSESDQALSGGAGTVADYRERVERSLANKVHNMLSAVLGPGRATVEVSAKIDMTSGNLVTKTYEPKGVVVTEEITEKSKPVGGGEGEKPGKETEGTITTESLFGEKIETTVALAGKITSLAVAAIVDLKLEIPAVAADEEEGVPAKAAETIQIMALEDVKKLIENALGLDLAAGDTLEVIEAKFNRPTVALLGEEDFGGLDIVAIAGQASLGIMAICGLLVLKMFSGAKEKAGQMAAPGELAAGNVSGGLLPAGTGSADSLVLRKQIASRLQSDPDQAKQIFSNWLNEKGS